jgi:hypothetical protein
VATADLHELEMVGAIASTGQMLDRNQQFASRRRVAEFVNEFHIVSSR